MIEKLKKYSYLSGATFFDLLVETKANTDSEGNEISNYQILLELAKVFKDDEDLSFDGKGATEQTSKYRSGTAGAPIFLGLDDEQLVKKFIDRVKTNRNGIEDKISDFIKSYLYIENENPWIVYALLDMIKNDELIPSDVVLFSDGDGNCVTKDNINEIACVDLASMLLDIWCYALQVEDARKKVKEFYDAFTKKARDGKRFIDKDLFKWDKSIEIVKKKPTSREWKNIDEEAQIDEDVLAGLVAPELNPDNADSIFLLDPYGVMPKNTNQGSFSIPPALRICDKPTQLMILRGDFEGLKKKVHGVSQNQMSSAQLAIWNYLYGKDSIYEKYCNETFRKKLDVYLSNVQEKYAKKKTLLYEQAEPFYNFYVPNRIKKRVLNPDDLYETRNLRGIMTEPTIQKLYDWSKFIFITGTGGLGKSMMMQHLILDAAKNYDTYEKIPVLVELKRYTDEKYIEKMAYEVVEKLDLDISEEEFMNLLKVGKVTLLLDGMDEIKTHYKLAFEEDFEGFLDRFSQAQIIVSSRGHENFITFGRVLPTELQGFTLDEAIQLIGKLNFRPDEPEIKESFLNQLNSKLYRTHRDFIEIPLLLTIMLMTYERFSRIPDKIHVFYKEAYETLAVKHDATKGASYNRQMKTGLDSDEFADYLAEFCARSYQQEVFEYDDMSMRDYFNNLSIVKQNKPNFTYNDFIEDLKNNLCLFQESESKYEWTHRTFQEYFAAVFFAKQKDKHLFNIGIRVFNKKRKRSTSDVAFGMMYDLIPNRIEEYIFLPYMKNIIDDIMARKVSDNITEEEEFQEELNEIFLANMPYWRFINRMYGTIRYFSGTVEDFDPVHPSEFLYRFLGDKFGILEMCEEVDLPLDEDTAIQTFGMYHPNYFDPEEEDVVEIKCIEDMDSVYIDTYGKPDIEGAIYEFEIDDIISDPDFWGEYIEKMLQDDFPMMVEYKSFLRLYEQLKKKYEEKAEDSVDIFDMLD